MGDKVVILWSGKLKSVFGKKDANGKCRPGEKMRDERERKDNRERRIRRRERENNARTRAKVSIRTLDPFEKTLTFSLFFFVVFARRDVPNLSRFLQ